MSITGRRSGILRGISLLVATVFTVTSLVGSPSEVLAISELFAQAGSLRVQSELRKNLYAMPAELGSLVSLWEPSAGNVQNGFVIHIQDAHANPEGQQNIAAMLEYLGTKSPGMVIGLEGAAGQLHPEYLNFFNAYPDANRAVIEDLHQKGELNGAELFLLKKSQKRPQTRGGEVSATVSSLEPSVSGVEDAALYHDNLQTHNELLSSQDEIQVLLTPIRSRLEKESSQKLNNGLRDFLKERNRRKEGRFGGLTVEQGDPDFQAYTRYLRQQALELLKIDLKDPIEQLHFPNLLRVVMLDEVRKGLDPEKARSQWEEVVRSLKAAAKDPWEKEFTEAFSTFGREKGFLSEAGIGAFTYPMERALYPRKLLEGLFRFGQKYKLPLDGKESFWQAWKLTVFQAEIDVKELMREMDLLEGQVIEKLTRSEEEKALVRELGNLDLLDKLLRLELSRPEYDNTRDEEDALRSFTAHSKPLGAFLDKAFHFYEISLKRDEALVEKSLALLSGSRTTSHVPRNEFLGPWTGDRVPVLVLYTGGFHTPGIEELLRQRNIGYAVFSPRITKTDRGEMYQKVMAGDNADLSAYFKIKNPFATKQAAIFFKEMLEVAAPALFEKYKMKPETIANQVKAAIEQHPVLSQGLETQLAQDSEKTSLRFSAKEGTGRQSMPIPSVSAVMPTSLTSVWRSPDAGEATTVNLAASSTTATATVNFGTAEALTLRIVQGAVTVQPKTKTATLNGVVDAAMGSLDDFELQLATVPASWKSSVRSEVRGVLTERFPVGTLEFEFLMVDLQRRLEADIDYDPEMEHEIFNPDGGVWGRLTAEEMETVIDEMVKAESRRIYDGSAVSFISFLHERTGILVFDRRTFLAAVNKLAEQGFFDDLTEMAEGIAEAYEEDKADDPGFAVIKSYKEAAKRIVDFLHSIRSEVRSNEVDSSDIIDIGAVRVVRKRNAPVTLTIGSDPARLAKARALEAIRSSLGLGLSEFGEAIGEGPDKKKILRYESGEAPISGKLFERAREVYRQRAPRRFQAIRRLLDLNDDSLIDLLMTVSVKASKEKIVAWENGDEWIPVPALEKIGKYYVVNGASVLRDYWELSGVPYDDFKGQMTHDGKTVLKSAFNKWLDGETPVPFGIMAQARKIYQDHALSRYRSFLKYLEIAPEDLAGQFADGKVSSGDLEAMKAGSKDIPLRVLRVTENYYRRHIRANLRGMREYVNMGRTEFSKALGVPISTLEHWETETAFVPFEKMKLAQEIITAQVRKKIETAAALMGLSIEELGDGQLRSGDKFVGGAKVKEWMKARRLPPAGILRQLESLMRVPAGDRLRRLRKQVGFSQNDLAKRIGISRSSIADMEAGRTDVSLAAIRALESILEQEAARAIENAVQRSDASPLRSGNFARSEARGGAMLDGNLSERMLQTIRQIHVTVKDPALLMAFAFQTAARQVHARGTPVFALDLPLIRPPNKSPSQQPKRRIEIFFPQGVPATPMQMVKVKISAPRSEVRVDREADQRLKDVLGRADKNIADAKAISVEERPNDPSFDAFFTEMLQGFAPSHLGAETLNGRRLYNQIKIVNNMAQELVANLSGGVQIQILNPANLPEPHTEIYMVTWERPGLLADLARAIESFGGNIAEQHVRTIRVQRIPQLGIMLEGALGAKVSGKQAGDYEEINVFIFEVRKIESKKGMKFQSAYDAKEFSEIDAAIRKKLRERGTKKEGAAGAEIKIKGTTNSGRISQGAIAQLHEHARRMDEVVFDIYGQLGESHREDPIRRAAAVRQDFERFIADLVWFESEAEQFPDSLVGGTQYLTYAKELIESMRLRTQEAVYAKRPKALRYRPSAWALFNQLLSERIEQAENAKKTVNNIPLEIVYQIQRNLRNLWLSEYQIAEREGAESRLVRESFMEAELENFEQALAQILKLQDAQQPAPGSALAAARIAIESEGGLKESISNKIKEGYSATVAVIEILTPILIESKKGSEKLRAMGLELELQFKRLVHLLREPGMESSSLKTTRMGQPTILIADRIEPFDLQEKLERFPEIVAIVLKQGSIGSHAAQFAIGKGIPTFIIDPSSEAARLIDDESLLGAEMIIDGEEGILYINPALGTQEALRQKTEIGMAYAALAKEYAVSPTGGMSGDRPITVKATVEKVEEIDNAVEFGADGVGLFRSEYLLSEDNEIVRKYLTNPTPENEKALSQYLVSMILIAADKTETGTIDFRLPDIQSDKDYPLLNPSKRYGPDYATDEKIGKNIYRIVISAALTANALSKKGNVRILVPASRTPEQMVRVLNQQFPKTRGERLVRLAWLSEQEKQYFLDLAKRDVHTIHEMILGIKKESAAGLPVKQDGTAPHKMPDDWAARIGKTPVGVMIEQPEHIHILDFLAGFADFFNFGLGDLTRHTFRTKRSAAWSTLDFTLRRAVTGISRGTSEDAHYFSELKPELLEQLDWGLAKVQKINEQRQNEHKPLITTCLCGALANLDPMILFLKYHNYRTSISVPPREIHLRKKFAALVTPDDTQFFRDLGQEGFNVHKAATAAVMSIKGRLQISDAFQEEVRKVQRPKAEQKKETGAPAEIPAAVPSPQLGLFEEKPAEGQLTYVLTNSYRVGNKLGIHARPSAMIVKTSKPYLEGEHKIEGFIWKGNDRFSLGSVMAVMMVDAGPGTLVRIELKGDSVERLKQLLTELEGLTDNAGEGEEPILVPVSETSAAAQPRSEMRAPAISDEDRVKFAHLVGPFLLNVLNVFEFFTPEETDRDVPGAEVLQFLKDTAATLQRLSDELDPGNPANILYYSPEHSDVFLTPSTANTNELLKEGIVKYEGETFKAMAVAFGFNEIRESLKAPLAALNEISENVSAEDIYSEPVIARIEEVRVQLEADYQSAISRILGPSGQAQTRSEMRTMEMYRRDKTTYPAFARAIFMLQDMSRAKLQQILKQDQVMSYLLKQKEIDQKIFDELLRFFNLHDIPVPRDLEEAGILDSEAEGYAAPLIEYVQSALTRTKPEGLTSEHLSNDSAPYWQFTRNIEMLSAGQKKELKRIVTEPWSIWFRGHFETYQKMTEAAMAFFMKTEIKIPIDLIVQDIHRFTDRNFPETPFLDHVRKALGFKPPWDRRLSAWIGEALFPKNQSRSEVRSKAEAPVSVDKVFEQLQTITVAKKQAYARLMATIQALGDEDRAVLYDLIVDHPGSSINPFVALELFESKQIFDKVSNLEALMKGVRYPEPDRAVRARALYRLNQMINTDEIRPQALASYATELEGIYLRGNLSELEKYNLAKLLVLLEGDERTREVAADFLLRTWTSNKNQNVDLDLIQRMKGGEEWLDDLLDLALEREQNANEDVMFAVAVILSRYPAAEREIFDHYLDRNNVARLTQPEDFPAWAATADINEVAYLEYLEHYSPEQILDLIMSLPEYKNEFLLVASKWNGSYHFLIQRAEEGNFAGSPIHTLSGLVFLHNHPKRSVGEPLLNVIFSGDLEVMRHHRDLDGKPLSQGIVIDQSPSTKKLVLAFYDAASGNYDEKQPIEGVRVIHEPAQNGPQSIRSAIAEAYGFSRSEARTKPGSHGSGNTNAMWFQKVAAEPFYQEHFFPFLFRAAPGESSLPDRKAAGQGLTIREQDVLKKRFGIHEEGAGFRVDVRSAIKLKEIAAAYGNSSELIQAIEAKALSKAIRMFRETFPLFAHAGGYELNVHHVGPDQFTFEWTGRSGSVAGSVQNERRVDQSLYFDVWMKGQKTFHVVQVYRKMGARGDRIDDFNASFWAFDLESLQLRSLFDAWFRSPQGRDWLAQALRKNKILPLVRSEARAKVGDQLEKQFQKMMRMPDLLPNAEGIYSEETIAGREIHTVGVRHYSRQALQIIHDTVLPKMLQNPGEWLFILEYAAPEVKAVVKKQAGNRPVFDPPEELFSFEIARALRIPVVEPSPVVSLLGAEVTRELERKGMDAGAALKLSVLDFRSKALKRSQNFSWGSMKDIMVKTYAEQWRFNRQVLEAAYDELRQTAWQHPEELPRIQQELTALLIRTSNDLMRPRVRAALARYPEKTKIFILAGRVHAQAAADEVKAYINRGMPTRSEARKLPSATRNEQRATPGFTLNVERATSNVAEGRRSEVRVAPVAPSTTQPAVMDVRRAGVRGEANLNRQGWMTTRFLPLLTLSAGIGLSLLLRSAENWGWPALSLRSFQLAGTMIGGVVMITVANYVGQLKTEGVTPDLRRAVWLSLSLQPIMLFFFILKPALKIHFGALGALWMSAADNVVSVLMGPLFSMWVFFIQARYGGMKRTFAAQKQTENFWLNYGVNSFTWGFLNWAIFSIPQSWAFVIPVLTELTAFALGIFGGGIMYKPLKSSRMFHAARTAGFVFPSIALSYISVLYAGSWFAMVPAIVAGLSISAFIKKYYLPWTHRILAGPPVSGKPAQGPVSSRSEVRSDDLIDKEPFFFDEPGSATLMDLYQIDDEEAFEMIRLGRVRFYEPRNGFILPLIKKELWEPALVGLDFSKESDFKILDAGAGAGVELQNFPQELRKYLWLLDIGRKNLTQAAKNYPGVHLLRRDWFATKLPEASFDAIVGFENLGQMIDYRLAEFYREMGRLLKPGGQMHFLESVVPDEYDGTDASIWDAIRDGAFGPSYDGYDVNTYVRNFFEIYQTEARRQGLNVLGNFFHENETQPILVGKGTIPSPVYGMHLEKPTNRSEVRSDFVNPSTPSASLLNAKSEVRVPTAHAERIIEEVVSLKPRGLVLNGGPSASGKSTLIEKIREALRLCGRNLVTVSVDHYILPRDQRPLYAGRLSADHIDSYDQAEVVRTVRLLLQGESVNLRAPWYSQEPFLPPSKLETNDVLIVDGLHVLASSYREPLSAYEPLSVYVTAPAPIRFLRRLDRDMRIRGIAPLRTLEDWNHIRVTEEAFVVPTQSYAQFVTEQDDSVQTLELYEKLRDVLTSLENDPEVLSRPELLQILEEHHAFYQFFDVRSEMRVNEALVEARIGFLKSFQAYLNWLSEGDAVSEENPPDVVLMAGNPDIDNYLGLIEQWQKWYARGFKVPVVLAGGRGRGTRPMYEAIRRHLETEGITSVQMPPWSDEIKETDLFEVLFRAASSGTGWTVYDVMKKERLLYKEKQGSRNTSENVEYTLETVQTILAKAGIRDQKPRILIVTRPDLLRRMVPTVYNGWGHTGEWEVLRYNGRPIDVASASDSQLMDWLVYTVLGGTLEKIQPADPSKPWEGEIRGARYQVRILKEKTGFDVFPADEMKKGESLFLEALAGGSKFYHALKSDPDIEMTLNPEAGHVIVKSRSEVRSEAQTAQTSSVTVRNPQQSAVNSVRQIYELQETYPQVFNLHDPQKEAIELLIYPEPSGHFLFNHAARERSWDGTLLKDNEKPPVPVEVSWESLEAPYQRRLGRDLEQFEVYSAHNVYHNDWFVAYDGTQGRLYHRKGEPFTQRTYTMFVVMKNGEVRSEDLRFETVSEEPMTLVKAYRANDPLKQNIGPSIKFALFGQRLVHEGRPVPFETIGIQWEDLFHIYRLPGILKDPSAGIPKGKAIGEKEMSSGAEVAMTPKDRPVLQEILAHDGYWEVDTRSYRERVGYSPLTLEEFEQRALTRVHYERVEPRIPEKLKENQYFIDEAGILHIRFRKALYPHNLVGITRSGKVAAIVLSGNKQEEKGYTLKQVQDIVMRGMQERDDPIQEAFLLANSKDAFTRRNGDFVKEESSPLVYTDATAGMAFLRPVRSEMRAGLIRHQREEILQKIEQVIQRMKAEEIPGGIKDTIQQIRSDRVFQEGGIVYIPKIPGGELLVIGDLHGDWASLQAVFRQYDVFEKLDRREPLYVVFIGDYSLGGNKNVETLMAAIDLKLRHPEKVTLLRGNHDQRETEAVLAQIRAYIDKNLPHRKGDPKLIFSEDVKDQYDETVYEGFVRFFESLPTGLVTSSGIVLAHASPPSGEIHSLRDLVGNSDTHQEMMLNWPLEGEALAKTKPPAYVRIVDENIFERFMNTVGGSIFVRGHSHPYPAQKPKFHGRLETIITEGNKSPDANELERGVEGRFAVLPLDTEIQTIPASVTRFISSEVIQQIVREREERRSEVRIAFQNQIENPIPHPFNLGKIQTLQIPGPRSIGMDHQEFEMKVAPVFFTNETQEKELAKLLESKLAKGNYFVFFGPGSATGLVRVGSVNEKGQQLEKRLRAAISQKEKEYDEVENTIAEILGYEKKPFETILEEILFPDASMFDLSKVPQKVADFFGLDRAHFLHAYFIHEALAKITGIPEAIGANGLVPYPDVVDHLELKPDSGKQGNQVVIHILKSRSEVRQEVPPEMRLAVADASETVLEELRDLFVEKAETLKTQKQKIDLQPVLALALKIRPDFQSKIPNAQLASAGLDEIALLAYELSRFVFLPAGYFFDLGFSGQKVTLLWGKIQQDSWTKRSYMGEEHWSAYIQWIFSGAFVSYDGTGFLSRWGYSFTSLDSGHDGARLFFTYLLQEMAKRLFVFARLQKELNTLGFGKGMELVYAEKIDEPKIRSSAARMGEDDIFLNLWTLKHLGREYWGLNSQEKEEIVLKALLLSQSSLRQVYDKEKGVAKKSFAVSFRQYAAGLGGMIQQLQHDLSLAADQKSPGAQKYAKDMAYAVFLDFLSLEELLRGKWKKEGIVSAEEMTGRWLYRTIADVYGGSLSTEDLIRNLESGPEHPAEKALALLKKVYDANFLNDEERAKALGVSPARSEVRGPATPLQIGKGIRELLSKAYPENKAATAQLNADVRSFLASDYAPKLAITREIDALSDEQKIALARKMLKDPEIAQRALTSGFTLENILLLRPATSEYAEFVLYTLQHILSTYTSMFNPENFKTYKRIYEQKPELLRYSQITWKTVYALLWSAELMTKLPFSNKSEPRYEMRMHVENNLKVVHEFLAMNQEEFIAAMGLLYTPKSRNALRLWEAGTEPVPAEIAGKVMALIQEKVGPRVQMIREFLGMTPEEFIAALKLNSPTPPETLTMWETGKGPVSDEVMIKTRALIKEKAGLRLIMMRHFFGMTQEEFVEALKLDKPVSREALSMWEAEKRPVPDYVLAKAGVLFRKKAGPRLQIMREKLGMNPVNFITALKLNKLTSPETLAIWETGKIPVPAEVMRNAGRLVQEREGLRLQSMRKTLEMTQDRFIAALKLDVPVQRTALSMWENGKRPVPDEVMKKAEKLVELFMSRSEVRELALKGSTHAAKTTLSKVFGRNEVRKLVENWLSPEVQLPANEVALKLEKTFSVPGLAFYMDGNEQRARLYIALQLAKPFLTMAEEQKISNEPLAGLLEGLRQFVVKGAAVKSDGLAQGPELHINLAGLTHANRSELRKNFPVVLGALASFRARLALNVDMTPNMAASFQSELLDLARSEGIVLAEKQVRVVSAQGRNFFESLNENKPVDVLMMAREEKNLVRRAGVGSYWVTDDRGEMDRLAAAIATALLYSVSDQKAATGLNVQHPSQHQSLMDAALAAIQGYLEIRTAA